MTTSGSNFNKFVNKATLPALIINDISFLDKCEKGYFPAMTMIQKPGFDFWFDPEACEACDGLCCCGESGKIWVNPQEVLGICQFLEMNQIDFMEKHVDRIDGRISLKEAASAEGLACVFFETTRKKCSIYPVRPSQCREYPFWNYFKNHMAELSNECPGVIKTEDEKGSEVCAVNSKK